jgi:hypothetical protein
VVLAGDVASTRKSVGTRNVVATVAILHFGGLGPCGEREELVPKADTEDRMVRLAKGDRESRYGGRDHGGIAGAVGNEDPVIRLRLSQKVVVPGNDFEFCPSVYKASNLIILHAHVYSKDAKGASGGVQAGSNGTFVKARGSYGYLSDQIHLVWVKERNVIVIFTPRLGWRRGRSS